MSLFYLGFWEQYKHASGAKNQNWKDQNGGFFLNISS